MKKIFVLLLAVVLAVGAYQWWKKSHSGAAQQEQGQAMPPAEVAVVTVQPQNVTFTKDLPGRTSAVRVAEIRPQVSGVILKRLFTEGSDVTEGQQLYQIDPALYQAAYQRAEADLMRANANAKSVQAQSARYEELVKIGGVSKQEYDDIKAGLAQANADIAIAKAALSDAKVNLDYTKVLSPISGRIGVSRVTEGALATQNQQEPLTVVQQLNQIYVDVTQSGPELLALRRQLGNQPSPAQKLPVQLFIEGDNQPFNQQGEMQFSDVSVDETTGSVQLRILFPNPQRELLPGLFVRARVSQSQAENAILVSQKAVSRNPDGSTIVMVVGEGNKVQPRPIVVTEAVGDKWLVKEGLKVGDRVIVEGLMKVQPDAVVKPVEAKAAPEQKQPAEAPPAQPEEQAAPKQPAPEQQPASEQPVQEPAQAQE